MGQYWRVIAFTLRQTVGYGGNKLGQDLFDGSPYSLVLPLAVPVLPKGYGLTQPPDANLAALRSFPFVKRLFLLSLTNT